MRTDVPRREVTLRFEGPEEVLRRAVLVDEASGKVVGRRGAAHTFVASDGARAFTLKLRGAAAGR